MDAHTKHQALDPLQNQIRLFEMHLDSSGEISGVLHFINERGRPKY